MHFYRILLTLFWKCQILRKRNWISSLGELIAPVACFYVFLKLLLSFKTGDVEDNNYDFFKSLSNQSGYWEIAYAPSNKINAEIIKYFVEHIIQVKPHADIRVEAKQNEEELEEWLKNNTISNTTIPIKKIPKMGILFSEINSTNKRFKYKLRTTDRGMITNELDSKMPLSVYSQTSVFLGTEELIDKKLLRIAGVIEERPWNFGTLPSPVVEGSETLKAISSAVSYGYLFLIYSVIYEVMHEKENGTKELMKVLGVKSWMIWVHWFIYTMVSQVPSMIGCTFVLAVLEPVWIESALIIFLLLLLFTINLIIIVFAISCLFHKTMVAFTVCPLGWIVLNFLHDFFLINKLDKLPFLLHLLLSLVPSINLTWALGSLRSFEELGKHWTWSNLFAVGFMEVKISAGVSIIMFIVSSTIFTFVLMYLDAIFPGPYGVAKPLDFVCQWIRNILNPEKSFSQPEIIHEFPENFESTGQNAKVGIEIRGLRKTYGLSRQVVAVDHVDLDIYEGEILVLLGHNGAGKTTTMSMITGMTAPTGGVIIFDGQNITVNKETFRKNLGFCPQHNSYFSKLTVIEHLIFFAMLKGMTYSESKKCGRSILKSLNMFDKQNTMGSKLSGGMKRRLCLSVSLTGDPKVLILDEPTSGLDPQNRRFVWDIILKLRRHRTVLITTQLMEEADVLGDRIAIMDHGQVVCCGTSMFLKRLFGAGYRIHVLKKTGASVEEISNVVKQSIPQTQVRVVSNSQVDYIIQEKEHVERFPSLFSALESQQSRLDVTGITVTCPTMEDVFLKVAEASIEDPSKPIKKSNSLSVAENINEFQRLEGLELFYQQVKALFVKMMTLRLRDKIDFLFISALFLLILILIAFVIDIQKQTFEEQKELMINIDLYPHATVLIAYDETNKVTSDVIEKAANSSTRKIKTFQNVTNLEKYLKKESHRNHLREILFALAINNENISVRFHPNANVHSPAIAINFLSNILLRNKTNGTGTIQVINHPFVGECDESLLTSGSLTREFTSVFLSAFIAFGFISLFSGFVKLVTEDRVTGFKHQQFLAGVSPLVYWFGNLIFDFCVYFIVTVVFVVVFSILGPKSILLHPTLIGLLLLLLFLQGWSGLSLTYLFTFLFDNPVKSQGTYSYFMIILGMVPAIVLVILLIVQFISLRLHLMIVCLFGWNPIFATTLCWRNILRVILIEEFCRICKNEMCHTDMSYILRMPTEDDNSGILFYIVMLIFTSVLYPLLLILIDGGFSRKLFFLFKDREPDFSSPNDADNDVKVEIETVKTLKSETIQIPLRVESLEKTYMCGPKAVDKVCFTVMKGDCFGVLGVNGAGKSSTFNMLTAKILPDRGDAHVNSFSLKRDRGDYLSSIGYCPQIDAILPTLTGYEILTIIAKIRGVPSKNIKNLVVQWIDYVGIKEYGNERCGTYSGGNKRKLSTAMALIGSPEVVFLDEPTTGVDPVSRRKLWTAIKETQKQGQAVVLTSHSMEECEVLCSRLTIMVKGQLKCIGSIEYLKTKFSLGFTVLLKLIDSTQKEVDNLKQSFYRVFPNSSIRDENSTLIHYMISEPNMLLSQLFSKLLNFKNAHKIVEDFSVSSTSLEDLFLYFASKT